MHYLCALLNWLPVRPFLKSKVGHDANFNVFTDLGACISEELKKLLHPILTWSLTLGIKASHPDSLQRISQFTFILKKSFIAHLKISSKTMFSLGTFTCQH